jgi:hypothetical protein
VTNLIETCTIKITLNHDKLDGFVSSIYGGETDLRKIVEEAWPKMAPWFGMRSGKATLAFGAVLIEWDTTGIDEVPELNGGDN